VDKMRKSQGCSLSPHRPGSVPWTPEPPGPPDDADSAPGGDTMATYHVTLKNGTIEVIEGADAYQQEGR
jgi:hypothetical protein